MAHVAWAQAPDQKASAQVLFDKARALVQQKNFAEACPKFAESLRLDPGIGTMLWLADCYENNGQTASAWAQFKEAAGVAGLRADPREAVARRRAAALEPKLSNVVIALPPGTRVSGLEVRRDGVVISSAELGLALPMDPGVHTLTASAPGRTTWSGTVEVTAARAEPLVVNVPLLAEDRSAAGTERDPSLPASSSSEQNSAWGTTKYLGLGIAAVGVVGLGVGTALGLSAKSANDDSKADNHCTGNACDSTGKDLRSTAQSRATGATFAFAAGSAALAGGLLLFFLSPATKKSAWLPSVHAQGASMTYQTTF